MEQGSLAQKISALVEPTIEAMGLTLWGIEVTSANRPALIIYIDGEDGVTIDQCAEVSRDVGLILEVEDVISSAYVLEVSSPGLERKFFKPEQLSGYVGKKIDLGLVFPMDGRKKFRGILESTDEEGLSLKLEDQEDPISIEWDRIKKAKLVHEFK
ncbi:ribosome maturation factor RimP [Maridesulfovibrio sp.]|uniref:ribosome maturation factor RimP n=1 Tax=Maridesulfovibrio sp. TaxID=2795000 RepID=UPI002A18CD1E|nr:ribosome maturation factor RimP [Maridesulfovibrio sp.]